MEEGEVLAMPISPVAGIDQVDSYTKGAVVFIEGHGWFVEEVACAWGYLAVEDAWHLGEVVIDTHIDNAQVETMLTAEHVDASPTPGEVDHLLPSDFAWRDADSLTFDAMIASQKEMTRMCQGGGEGLLGKADLHGKGFETT